MQKKFYLLSFFSFLCFALQAQVADVRFGKNRVQYHQDYDEWVQYESDNFVTYWYGEGRNIGQFVVQMAEYDFEYIQSILEHRVNDKLEIIVYTDVTDLKQSNIGNEEAFTNLTGQTKIVGNKIFVYFNGDHTNLRQQIREGIASVYLEAMLFGANLQEIVQNAVMLNLPDWFKQGLAAYLGASWNTELDNQLRDAILDEDFKNFEIFAEENPKLAGQSLWYFIGENFGLSTVSNLLYLTRINRSIESGFLYVLGSPYEVVIRDWMMHFTARYKGEDAARNTPVGQAMKFKNKRKLPVTQLKISPNGQKVVYVTNEIGKTKVYLQDVNTGEREVIFKTGFRNAFQTTDYNYPLLSWNPNGQELAILYEKRDVPKLMIYNTITKKKEVSDLASNYQRVYSIDYVNTYTLVFSATVGGFSDLFMYYTKTRQSERITRDFYDDLDASFVNIGNKKGILFASNRQDSLIATLRMDTILPTNNFDIFYYDLETKSKELVRVTNTPFANERQPIAIDTSYFSYLSDWSGVFNREAAYLEEYLHHKDQIITLEDGEEIRIHIDSTLENLDSLPVDTIVIVPVIKQRAIAHTTTNYQRNIVLQDKALRANRMVEMIYKDGTPEVYFSPVAIDTVVNPKLTRYQNTKIKLIQESPFSVERPEKTRKRKRRKAKIETETSTPITAEPAEKVVEAPAVTPAKQDTSKIDITNYLFQSEFDEEPEKEEEKVEKVAEADKEGEKTQDEKISDQENIQPNPDLTIVPVQKEIVSRDQEGDDPLFEEKKVYRFRPGRIVPYRLKFRTDFVTTKMDNTLLFDGLESIASNPDGFSYPPPGILFKANFKDLFEDYEFEGGLRVPTSFNGTEYFAIFNNRKKRLDQRFAVYRRNLRIAEDNSVQAQRQENNILLGQYGVSYPLDIFRSIRATATIRRDRVLQLATDRATLEEPTISDQRIGIKLEYVFDNTLDVALNIKNGTRYKIWGEMVKKFALNFTDEFSFEADRGFMTILGLDARHYQRLDRNSIFAVRLAAATSFGSEQNLYFLGGVDNWLFPTNITEISTPQTGNFAYQTQAANLRGFGSNIRNGASYALVNTELRMPIFKYLSRRIRSSFLRNFQVIGFFDVGTAWVGSSPYSDENPLNTSFFPEGNPDSAVRVKVTYFRDPIVAGYGVGARALLFGYFVRVDYAWGIETREVQDPVWHFSLGMDF
ncbi:MAG: hypothetical protein HRU41_37780 [Saprospiraceae bacterium]|nr:hypothetical protein [Saprospiraceae bacterium]